MADGFGPLGVYGGSGYPAPLRGVSRFPKLGDGEWAKKREAPAPSPVADDSRCEIVWYGIRYQLPSRAALKINQGTGRAYVRAAGEISELIDGGRALVSPEQQRLLLEAWDTL